MSGAAPSAEAIITWLRAHLGDDLVLADWQWDVLDAHYANYRRRCATGPPPQPLRSEADDGPGTWGCPNHRDAHYCDCDAWMIDSPIPEADLRQLYPDGVRFTDSDGAAWAIGGPLSAADIRRGQRLYARYTGTPDGASPDTSQPYFLDLIRRIDDATEEQQ